MLMVDGLQQPRSTSAGRYTPPSKAARTVSNKLEHVIDAFRKIDTAMPSSYMRMFLAIARKPGYGSSVYARELGMVQPVASRIILELGQKTRSGGPGYELLDSDIDEEDFRLKRTYLTAKGQELYREIVGIYGREP
jgi:DNA-binding MarR family transcriptional regulator